MRTVVLAMCALTVSGCLRAGSVEIDAQALCEGTAAATTDHAAALALDGGPLSVSTGRALIAELDAACGRDGV